MRRAIPLFALVLSGIAAWPVAAQSDDASAQRVRQVIVYGTDPCPPSAGNEVIVCARRPETERYRIPENLREDAPSPESESWSERAEALEMVGRTGIQSCSPEGPGGASGCLQQFIRQSQAEREADATTQQNVP